MTKNSAAKKAARRRAIAERVSYTAARRRESAANAADAQPPSGEPVGPRPPLIRPAHWSLEQVRAIAETLLTISGTHVVRQHVVSQVILRNFTEKVDGAPRVGLYDAPAGRAMSPVGVKDVGVVKNFLRVDSAQAEKLWGQVETQLPAAAKAARTPDVVNQPEKLDVLRKAIALHYARASSTLDVMERTWTTQREVTIQNILTRDRDLLARHFRRVRGAEPSDDDLVEFVREFGAGFSQLVESGAWARVRMEQLYDQVLEKAESWGVEVVLVPGGDLVVSDNPVVLTRKGDDRRRAGNRMAVGDANAIFLPVAPDVLVSLGPGDGWGTANAEAVASLNASQVAGAHRFVFHRPSQNVGSLVGAAFVP
jgi:hypothetical protein